MRVNANAVLRSWTLLAAFGDSYAPDTIDPSIVSMIMLTGKARNNGPD